MKKILTSVAMFGLATALFGTSTFAWFSMNRQVDVKGLKVKAKVDSSLVITEGALPSVNTNTVTIDYKDETATELYNSTRFGNLTSAEQGTLNLFNEDLVYISNPGDIDSLSGIARTGKTIEYAEAVNSDTDSKYYYIDKIVYIASTGDSLEGKVLTITMSNGASTAEKNVNGAISVDVFGKTNVDAVQDSGDLTADDDYYLGTLNLAQLDISKNDAATAKTSIVVNGYDVPKALSGEDLIANAFLLRIYVDGRLAKTYDQTKKTVTSTYCANSDATSIKDQTLTFNFAITEPSA